MKLNITENKFKEAIALWKMVGMETFEVKVHKRQFFIDKNTGKASCTLKLPHNDAFYDDYAAMIYWIGGDDGSDPEREASRLGVSIPSNFTMSFDLADNSSVNIPVNFEVSGGSATGSVKITISCENAKVVNQLVSGVKSVTFVRPVWYTGYEEPNELNPDKLTPDNTVVVENLSDILTITDPSDKNVSVYDNKKYVLSLEDNLFEWEYCDGLSLSPSFFEIRKANGSEGFTNSDPIAPGSLHYKGRMIHSVNGRYYAVMKRMNFFFGDFVGYGADERDEILANENVLAEISDSTEAINGVLEYFDMSDGDMINLHLREKGLYYISSPLNFKKSNVCLMGNGSIIKVRYAGTDALSVFTKPNTEEIKNIEINNVTVNGRVKYDPVTRDVPLKDQCIRFCKGSNANANKPFPHNFTIHNLTADGFNYGAKVSGELINKTEDINGRFIDCNFSRTRTGYHFYNAKNVTVSGGSVDNSLSTTKGDHCFYIDGGCSCITVENCLLKNSTGAAIHQMYGALSVESYDDIKIHDTVYRNLTIENCADGIAIGVYSFNALVEDIHGTEIGSFARFDNCAGVIVRRYEASQRNDPTITVGTGDEVHSLLLYDPEQFIDHYQMFCVNNCVKAMFEDCNFNNYCVPDQNTVGHNFVTTNTVGQIWNDTTFEEGWVKNECAVVNLTFKNCRFMHVASVTTKMGPHSTSYQVFDLSFEKCVFDVRTYNLLLDVYNTRSSDKALSTCKLDNCKAYYTVENIGTSVAGPGYLFWNSGANLIVANGFTAETSFPVGDNVNPILNAVYQ